MLMCYVILTIINSTHAARRRFPGTFVLVRTVLKMFARKIPESRFRTRKSQNRAQSPYGPPTYSKIRPESRPNIPKS